jgi:PKD repeat protein
VVDDAGRQATVSVTVTVGGEKLPTATFTTIAGAAGSHAITADATSSTAVLPATIVGYEWDFGDGARDVGAVRTHTYLSAGIYAVRLTVTDSKGLTATTVKSVTVQ